MFVFTQGHHGLLIDNGDGFSAILGFQKSSERDNWCRILEDEQMSQSKFKIDFL